MSGGEEVGGSTITIDSIRDGPFHEKCGNYTQIRYINKDIVVKIGNSIHIQN